RLVEQRVDGDYFQDPYRENIGFDSIDELEANRAAHIAACRHAFEEVEVFILTLGLNECWEFIPDGSVISRGPKTSHHFALSRHRVLSVDENLACLQRFLDVVRAHNPALKLIVTVSPVPLLATGLADDTHVIAANGHSKAVLRTAAEELRRRNDGVYYFPSYEMVSYCLNDPWEDDTRHVKRAAVAQIMTAFKAAFAKPV
ncbi:MAG: GSCFA domain-containing protein, partial [Rhodospirillales bacterium]|nr:GSCFA domain-containing protein [Rhodospirillales bacterium]